MKKRGLGSTAQPGAKLGAFGGLSFQAQALRSADGAQALTPKSPHVWRRKGGEPRTTNLGFGSRCGGERPFGAKVTPAVIATLDGIVRMCCLCKQSGEWGMGRLGLRWRMVEHGCLWGLLSDFCAARLREVRARRSTHKIANAPTSGGGAVGIGESG